jgi:hypothetical protein
MQDLSDLMPGGTVNCLTPTSQQGGNQIVSNELAMTAKGGQPSSPATSLTGEELDHKPPVVESIKVPTGPPGPWHSRSKDDGAPDSGASYSPPPPAWKKTH